MPKGALAISGNISTVETFAKRQRTAAAAWRERADSVLVDSTKDFERAAHLIHEAKDLREWIAEQRAAALAKAKAFIAEVENLLAPAINDLEIAEEKLKGRIQEWAEGEKLQLVTDTKFMPSAPGVQLRRVWEGKLMDAGALPEQYFVPDLRTLEALTKVKGGELSIPGWTVERKIQVAIVKKG